MKKSVEILGLPIISITEGRELGVSKSLLIDAKNGVVAAITIEDDDWYRGIKLIPYEAIIAIGEDAVTINHSENILTLEEAGDYERLLIENVHVIGTKAITKKGRIEGKISEIIIGDGGKIECCEITTPDGSINEVTADQISIFGKEVTVVDISEEKKNSFVEDKPAFEPTQEVWTPVVEEPVVETVETPAVTFDAPVETVETPAENFNTPVETVETPAENLTVPVETVETPAENFTAPVETVETPAENFTAPVEIPDAPKEESAPVEEISTPEPEVKAPEEVLPPVEEEKPAVKVKSPEEEQKTAARNQQAEALREALKRKAQENKQTTKKPDKSTILEINKRIKTVTPSTPQKPDKPLDDRRRRVLLGKHATKTITAESGTVVVEAGAEVTEEVLQRARLSNKFIELSMNVQ